MNKGRRCFLAAAIVSISLFNLLCSGKKPQDPGRYYSPDKEFSIVFPDGWQVKVEDSFGGSFTEAVSPWESDEDIFSEYIGIDIEEMPQKTGLSDLFDSMVEEQAGEFDYFAEIERGDIRINGEEAKFLIFDIAMAEGKNRVISYTMVRGRKSCLISCVAEDLKYDEYKNMFERSAATFRFE
ncbi:MAG: hypothetical protein JW814_03820 [Candidatus Krumholzibacteriota bacterium]|nr:hypothetical protein [Candidatus Krumholzibacteriota bacterium]